MKPFIYLRALKHAEHTVFCVQEGQKTYYDAQFGQYCAYSSGQQVKRSILEELTSALNVPMAPVTFNYSINKKELENKEPWSPCDPNYIDQLIGGWMKAGDGITVKRRSPLSISAMRPLHPLLSGTVKENLTFDRSNRPDRNPVNVRMAGSDKLLTEEEIETFLATNNRTLPRRNWIPDNRRAQGLFVYDIAIDLRTLFAVSTNQHEPELTKEKIGELKSKGWVESENTFGKCLIMPKSERDKVIPALASALINWRITSNQARTFSLMETLAIAISDNANQVAYAIRAALDADADRKANPIIDETSTAKIFLTPSVSGFIKGASGNASALDDAAAYLKEQLNAFPYQNQMA